MQRRRLVHVDRIRIVASVQKHLRRRDVRAIVQLTVNATVSRDLHDVCSSAVSRGVQRRPLLPFAHCNLRPRNHPPHTA